MQGVFYAVKVKADWYNIYIQCSNPDYQSFHWAWTPGKEINQFTITEKYVNTLPPMHLKILLEHNKKYYQTTSYSKKNVIKT